LPPALRGRASKLGGIVITAEKFNPETATLAGDAANEWDALSAPKEMQ
jgi:hypothetical protein